ncbi:hypothetical protein RB595_005989 [Gaeumannomyces hyphopodioides]
MVPHGKQIWNYECSGRLPSRDVLDISLHFSILHLFLPPNLPHPPGRAMHEKELLKSVYDSLTRFCECLDATRSPMVHRCTQMLRCMMGPPDAFGDQLVELGENDCLAVHLDKQNAGLLVTRVGTEIRFESLGLLAPDDVVMGCEGRLRRRFPSRAVAVARSRVIDPAFLKPFLDVLSELRSDNKPKISERFRINFDSMRDSEPVNGVIMGVLCGIGRSLIGEAVFIHKHSREEAWVEADTEIDRRNYRCRSSLWLLIRVVLQLTLCHAAKQHEGGGGGGGGDESPLHHPGRPLYKALMIFLMSRVLDKAVHECAPHDLLLFMKAKISRRILKLGSTAAGAPWCDFPREVLRRVHVLLTESWDTVQSLDAPKLPLSRLSRLDFNRDTLPSLNDLRPHLEGIAHRESAKTPGNAAHSLPFRRAKTTDGPRNTFSSEEELGCFELIDFENYVEARVQNYLMSPLADLASSQTNREEGAEVRSQNSASGGLASRRFGEQPDDSRWVRSVDNAFARKFWAEVQAAQEWRQASPRPRLCDGCRTLDPLDSDFKLLVSQVSKSEDCDLCEMLHRALWPHGTASRRPALLRREGTSLSAGGQSKPILRMCVGLGWEGDSSIQIGPPQPMERPSPLYYELLRSWILRCDGDHAEFGCTAPSQTTLPTRVIDVGEDSTNRGLVRLVCTGTSDRGRYIALSHCWGNPSAEEKERNCTFAANLKDRCLRIDLTKLGKTFQDAVKVTRGLGQRYLWIDSLCILQDDPDDWERESRQMGVIFSLAYCVIAATAAEGTDTGFLKPPPLNRFVALLKPSLSAPLYLCTTVDDFHGDVEVASLSRRGWVLQERALARRTIHLSAGQTYWECGHGIHCESLSLLKKNCQFPRRPPIPQARYGAGGSQQHTAPRLPGCFQHILSARAYARHRPASRRCGHSAPPG